ncbi:MAG: energy-coupling factor transporter transmembrane component T [Syntrophomonadaceae bacterium]
MYKLGQYVPASSLVHERDPRVKIAALVLLSLLILRLNILGIGLVYVLVLGLALLAHILWRDLWGASRPVWPLFLVLFCMYLLFTPGQPLIEILPGRVYISQEGLDSGLLLVGRFWLLVLAAEMLTMTTSIAELAVGLQKLLKPLHIIGISSHNLALMVSLAFRFLPALQIEMNQMRDAQVARGANYDSMRARLRAVKSIAIPLVFNIMRRSEELVTAMEARGYKPGIRSYLYEPVLDGEDCLAIVLISLAGFAVWWWKTLLIL